MGARKVQTFFPEESLTQQSDAEQADIQKILKRYREVGIVEHLNLTEASFADVTELTDYAEVMRTAKLAEVEFMKLPSKVREIFNHDVADWLDTANDPEKRASLLAEGDIESLQEPTPGNPPAVSGGDASPGDENPPNTP